MSEKLSIGIGAATLASMPVTLAAIAVLYALHAFDAAPFLPFDAFDWTARKLPGDLVTFGIERIVELIAFTGAGETSSTAKRLEMGMAVIGFVIALAVAGALLAILAVRRLERRGVWLAAVIGAVLWSAGALFGGAVGRPVAALGVLVLALVGAAWGAAIAWAARRLIVPAPRIEGDVVALDRRRFIVRLGGATAGITVFGTALGAVFGRRGNGSAVASTLELPWSAANPLPNTGQEVEPVPGTRPELTPLDRHYRIDINTRMPDVDVGDWRLRITGLVQRPTEMTIQDLFSRFEPVHQFVTLSCISNEVGGDLIGTTRWTGARLSDVLDVAQLRPEATHLRIRSADGFHETVALADVRSDPRIMLAYAWDGLPLRQRHGAPLRVYLPDRYGMKQPKWIESIEAIDEWEAGYWVRRGWDREARMKATSVIDTVVGDEANGRVLVGGIAHAGARGISAVQVSVDDGPWQDARLRKPLSATTWVIWRHEMPFRAGEHTFTVRCREGDGARQIESVARPHPSGATGLHRVRRRPA